MLRGEVIVLGPGKADLLAAIERLGSIRDAAAELGMSYMRAWQLVRTMNESFTEPVVTANRGGATRGGASLTRTGTRVLELYREMESASLAASSPAWRRLGRYLRR